MELVPIDVILSSGEANGESLINLDAPVFIMDEIRDVVGVTVMQASIPFSYYVFDNLTNQFKITVTGGSTPAQATYTCTIVPGSYTSVSLVPQLTRAFQTAVNGSNAVVDLSAAGFQAWVDTSTSTLVIYTTGTSTTFNVNFTGVNSSQRIIGFYGGQTVNSTNAATTTLYDNNDIARTTGHYVISPFSVNLSGENLLMLHSSLAGSVYGTVRTHTNAADILQFVNVNNNYQGMIEWVNPNPTEHKPMTKTTLTRVSFYFTLGFRTRHRSGATETQFLEFQGNPFQLVLRFYQVNDSKIDYMSNALGDRYTRAHAQTGSTQQPHQTKFQSKNKKKRAALAA